MKNRLIKITSLTTCCCAFSALAQLNQTTESSRDRGIIQTNRLVDLEKAGKIIGLEVKDSQNEKLGRVKDLAVDLQNGRIVEVIVTTSGMLGVDEQFVAVPPAQFTVDANEKKLLLNVETTRFKGAPTFKLSEWDSITQTANISRVYQYYGTKPYFSQDERPTSNQSPLSVHAGEIRRASKLIGMTAENPQNEKLGKVENLIVDLPAGRVVEVVVASGGFLGLGGELSAVPPQSFYFAGGRGILTLDTTKEALLNAPHFKSSDRSAATSPDQVVMVYSSYHVDPYFTTNAVDDTTQNVRDRNDHGLTPLNQGSSPEDVNTTRQIRKQIMAVPGLSVNAKNVKIITIDGRVTLRGPVNTEDEKRQVVAIAVKVASEPNVDVQLQVKSSSPGE